MREDNATLRVAVSWSQLAEHQAQRQRIAQACGAEPLVWDGSDPAPDVEVLVASEVPESVPAATPHLRLVQSPSAGMERFRDHPIWRSEVLLCSASGVHGVQIGEHVMLLLLALRRSLPRYVMAQARQEWLPDPDHAEIASQGELHGLTLGLIGYGHIGRGVAHLARAFGMRVLAATYSARERTPLPLPEVAPFVDRPAIPAPTLAPDELLPLSELDSLLAQSDVVVVAVPLTEETTNLLDRARLARMKPQALLINIARGKIVDEEALVQALRDGQLAGAGLDVTREEPLPPESPLWSLPNVMITPHISGRSDHYVERVVNILLANIESLRRGERPLTAVERQRGY